MAPTQVLHTATGEHEQDRRAALYCRAASTNRDDAQQTLIEQAHELRAYALTHGFTIVGEYHGVAPADATTGRPALVELYADLDAGKVDVVLVAALDRLALTRPVLRRILERFDAAGVRLVSLAESYDSATPEGRALLAALTEA